MTEDGQAVLRHVHRVPQEKIDVMLERARRLITPSARSDVPPFMVMDVMAAAARIEAQGGRVVHMDSGLLK